MVTSRDPREALRDAIGKKRLHEGHKDRTDEAYTKADNERLKAKTAVSAANNALGLAKANHAKQMADDYRAGGKGNGDQNAVRAARTALAEAEDHFAALTEVVNSLKADVEKADRNVLAVTVTSGISAVLVQPVTEMLARAIQAQQTYVAHKDALSYLLLNGLLIGDLRADADAFRDQKIIDRSGYVPLPLAIPKRGIGEFVAAIEKLHTDPDVQIPVI